MRPAAVSIKEHPPWPLYSPSSFHRLLERTSTSPPFPPPLISLQEEAFVESTLALENLKRRFGREDLLNKQLEQESERMASAFLPPRSGPHSASRGRQCLWPTSADLSLAVSLKLSRPSALGRGAQDGPSRGPAPGWRVALEAP